MLPKVNSENIFLDRMKMLAINTLYLLAFFGIINRTIETTLLFDLVNFVVFGLILINCLACLLYYKKPSEVISFIVVGLISVDLITQSITLNIDRSRSFYVLSWADKDLIKYHEGTLDLKMVQSTEKLNASAIELRIIEQQKRNLIEISESKVKLTSQGKMLLKFSNITAEFLGLRNWQKNKF
jgi:hypothetical protein